MVDRERASAVAPMRAARGVARDVIPGSGTFRSPPRVHCRNLSNARWDAVPEEQTLFPAVTDIHRESVAARCGALWVQ